MRKSKFKSAKLDGISGTEWWKPIGGYWEAADVKRKLDASFWQRPGTFDIRDVNESLLIIRKEYILSGIEIRRVSVGWVRGLVRDCPGEESGDTNPYSRSRF